MSNRSLYVELNGDQDVAHRDDLHQSLPEPQPADKVIIDCRNVFFIDSTAMGVLVRYRGRFVEAGGQAENVMVIAPAGSTVRRALDIAGLSRVFRLLDYLPDDAEGVC